MKAYFSVTQKCFKCWRQGSQFFSTPFPKKWSLLRGKHCQSLIPQCGLAPAVEDAGTPPSAGAVPARADQDVWAPSTRDRLPAGDFVYIIPFSCFSRNSTAWLSLELPACSRVSTNAVTSLPKSFFFFFKLQLYLRILEIF